MSANLLENENDKHEKHESEIANTIYLPSKDPSHTCWTFWYYKNDRDKSWEQNQKEIVSFDTVDEFWSLYKNINLASKLRQGCNYSLFKKGIRPMWEDDANIRGGHWLINSDKKNRGNDLDKLWTDVILCLIGEAFENSDEVCGAVVNIRGKGDKIGVWTTDATHSSAILEIGTKLKEKLCIAQDKKIVYQAHGKGNLNIESLHIL